MSFLPKGTKIPSTSNYLSKIPVGETTFRALAPAITGYEYFNTENKPVRSKDGWDEMPEDIGSKDGKLNQIKYFWAFPIYNHDEERIQIAQFSQKTILTPLEALINNGRWGNPMDYDITIKRTGTTMNDTEYSVVPNPKEKVSDEILKKFHARNLDINLLYEGIDPFNVAPSKGRTVQASGLPEGVEAPSKEEEELANSIPF